MKGQLSAEMVILLIVVIAVVAIVASNLLKGAKKGSSAFESKVSNISDKMASTCFDDSDCSSGQMCINGTCS